MFVYTNHLRLYECYPRFTLQLHTANEEQEKHHLLYILGRFWVLVFWVCFFFFFKIGNYFYTNSLKRLNMFLGVLSEFFQLADWAASPTLTSYLQVAPWEWLLDYKRVKGVSWRLGKRRERERDLREGWVLKECPQVNGALSSLKVGKKVSTLMGWVPFSFWFVPRTLHQPGQLEAQPGTSVMQFKHHWGWAGFKVFKVPPLGFRGRQRVWELTLSLSRAAFPGLCVSAKLVAGLKGISSIC